MGEPRVGLDGRTLRGRRKESYCAFPVQIRAHDTVEADVAEFLQYLAARRSELRRIHATGARVALYLMWTCRHPPGFQFGVEQLSALAELGIELWVESV